MKTILHGLISDLEPMCLTGILIFKLNVESLKV